jgi:RNA recognition motif-containing protein
MNSAYSAKNRMSQRANFSKNTNSSFRQPTRRPRFNKRFIPRTNRNRLQRVQNVININKNYQRPYQQRPYNGNNNISNNTNINGNVNNRNGYNNREIYVKNLPRFVDDQMLFNLFKKEGMILSSNILYDNVGFSRGIGRILFMNFKDTMNVIKKWNNTEYKGNVLKVEYKTVKNGDNRNSNYNKFGNGNVNNRWNNNYVRPFNPNFNRNNTYSTKFRSGYYSNNNYSNNGFNRYHAFRNNRNY